MRSSPAGLHLWAVELRNVSEQLWITTTRPSAEVAARKAASVIKRLRRKPGCGAASLDTIVNHGTIDA